MLLVPFKQAFVIRPILVNYFPLTAFETLHELSFVFFILHNQVSLSVKFIVLELTLVLILFVL